MAHDRVRNRPRRLARDGWISVRLSLRSDWDPSPRTGGSPCRPGGSSGAAVRERPWSRTAAGLSASPNPGSARCSPRGRRAHIGRWRATCGTCALDVDAGCLRAVLDPAGERRGVDRLGAVAQHVRDRLVADVHRFAAFVGHLLAVTLPALDSLVNDRVHRHLADLRARRSSQLHARAGALRMPRTSYSRSAPLFREA